MRLWIIAAVVLGLASCAEGTWPWQQAASPGPGRLNLSNFTFDKASVEAVVTTAPDCAVPPNAPRLRFVLPLNATRVIDAPAGADICWRREAVRSTSRGAMPNTAPWTDWSRAYLSTGRVIDARL